MRQLPHAPLGYITDPTTGRRYPIIGGGNGDATPPAPPPASPPAAPPATDPAAPPAPSTDPDDPEAHLGDPGKRALDDMKGKWKAERDQRKTLQTQLNTLQAELEQLKNPPAPGGPATPPAPDVDQIRTQAERDALAKANQRILRAEVKAAAAGKLSDPEDAIRFLDLDDFDVTDDGDVDTSEIADAISDLLKSKPYLGAQSDPKWQGGGDGGARNGSAPDPGPGVARVKAAFATPPSK